MLVTVKKGDITIEVEAAGLKDVMGVLNSQDCTTTAILAKATPNRVPEMGRSLDLGIGATTEAPHGCVNLGEMQRTWDVKAPTSPIGGGVKLKGHDTEEAWKRLPVALKQAVRGLAALESKPDGIPSKDLYRVIYGSNASPDARGMAGFGRVINNLTRKGCGHYPFAQWRPTENKRVYRPISAANVRTFTERATGLSWGEVKQMLAQVGV